MALEMINKRRLKIETSPSAWLVSGLIKYNDDFITELSRRLMLDELLCGECDPKQFLIETMNEILNDKKISRYEKRINELKGED